MLDGGQGEEHRTNCTHSTDHAHPPESLAGAVDLLLDDDHKIVLQDTLPVPNPRPPCQGCEDGHDRLDLDQTEALREVEHYRDKDPILGKLLAPLLRQLAEHTEGALSHLPATSITNLKTSNE